MSRTPETRAGLDEHFRALTHRYRRRILASLRSAETPMALADLTDELVRRETGQSPTSVPSTRERIYTMLYHRHLPELADAGLVSFDADDKLVSPGPDAERVAPLLDQATDGNQRPTRRRND